MITVCNTRKGVLCPVYNCYVSYNVAALLLSFLLLPAMVFHGIACCVTHFRVPFLWRLQRFDIRTS